MQILFINPFFTPWIPGGAEHSLELLCRHFASQRWNIKVIAVSLDGRSNSEQRDGYSIIWLPAPERVPPGQDIPEIPYLRTKKYIDDVRAAFQMLNYRPDFLIANNAQSYASASSIAAFSGIPSIGIVRDTQMICETGACIDNVPAKTAIPCSGYAGAGLCMIRFRRVREGKSIRPWPAWFLQGMQQQRRRMILRNTAKTFNHLVTISDSLKILVRRALPIYPEKSITTIANLSTFAEAVKPEDFSTYMLSHGLTKNKYFLFAGRKTYGKGVDLAIQAIRSVRKFRNDIQLLLVGRGKVESNSNDGVRDLSSVSQSMLMALLSNSLALVIPGRWQEGLHRTMIDALRLGIPVICSEAGAPSVEGVKDGLNGRIIKCNDAALLAEAMIDVLRWGDKEKKLCVEESLRIFYEKFSDDVVIYKWKKLFSNFSGNNPYNDT